MHCKCCDAMLTDFEATRRNANTFEFVDLCNECFSEVKHIVPVIERKDLMKPEDFEIEGAEDEYIEDIEDIKEFINYKYL